MKTVIEMAREAGIEFDIGVTHKVISKQQLERFAALVREDAWQAIIASETQYTQMTLGQKNAFYKAIKGDGYYIAKEKEFFSNGRELAKALDSIEAAVLAEREACAKVCDELFDTIEHDWSMMEGAGQCAAAIRARGE